MVLVGYNLYNHRDTQKTYRALASEIVQLFGIPIRYIPKVISDSKQSPFNGSMGFGTDMDTRSNAILNHIYGEDVNIAYRKVIPMKAILSNYDAYEGVHNLFNKFGFSMEDEITLEVETESWRNIMSRFGYSMLKPQEGDLIIFDLALAKNSKPQIFEIQYCNESESYFSFGQLMVFKIYSKVWEYSHETLDTGDEDIDRLNTTVNKEAIRKDIGDNDVIEEKSEELNRFDPRDPFGDEFSNN